MTATPGNNEAFSRVFIDKALEASSATPTITSAANPVSVEKSVDRSRQLRDLMLTTNEALSLIQIDGIAFADGMR
jgi:hypothetical protein